MELMSTWAKSVLRTIGILNCVVLLLGLSFQVDSVFQVLTGGPHINDARYFGLAFAMMASIEFMFAGALLLTSIGFVRIRLSSANPYSIAVVLRIAYFLVVGELWHADAGVGDSVGAATGLSDATTLFNVLFVVPFLYPALSMIFVQVLRYRYSRLQTLVSA